MVYPMPSQQHYHPPISSNMPNPRPLLPMTQFAPHTLHYSPTRPPNHHHLPRISTSRSEHQNNTLIIEHVKPCQLNYNFITSILKYTNIHILQKTISITLPTSCTSFLLSQRRVIKSNPTFSHLLIRTDRSHNMRMWGSIIYHAIKQGLAPRNVKCTFNDNTDKFELRHVLNSRIDWINNDLLISDSEFNKWSASYENFKFSTKAAPPSPNSSNSSPTVNIVSPPTHIMPPITNPNPQ